MSENQKPELVLFHILNDDACAEVRRFIVQQGFMDKVQFRNIDRSEEATKDLMSLQGHLGIPFLTDQKQRFSGKNAILDFLQTLTS